jgi:O-acetyl-ADP-ribose deacetylase (regulator of RNase III)
MVFLMITFKEGNLLEAKVEALVNTVNTAGVMGKGIALMFKEAFPENFRAYEDACKKNEVNVGSVFVTERKDLLGGPKWIVNFPTKKHWRNPSKLDWIKDGLEDLKKVIKEKNIHSIALPPLGSGNGGLDWHQVKPIIVAALNDLQDVTVIVYEPTARYQNVAKAAGVEKLTPARALVSELVRRYSVLGFECTMLEIHKLAYLLQRRIVASGTESPLKLNFQADKFGPYAPNLGHLLDKMDGSYLHCEKRVADASVLDTIWFEEEKKDTVLAYLKSEAKAFQPALDETTELIDGFEYPLGLELLGTVDWLLDHDKVAPSVAAIKQGLGKWLDGGDAAKRKLKLFEDDMIEIAVARLGKSGANIDAARP